MNEYTEQEQLAIAKQWLKDKGKYFIVGIAIILIGYGGWNFYQYNKQQRIEQTAVLYQQFEDSLTDIVIKSNNADSKIKAATAVLTQLQDDYATNGRTLLAALQLASLETQRNNLDSARTHLDWAMDNAPDEGYKQLINYRLASVEFAQQKHDSALQRLGSPLESFTALYAELEGDILMATSQYVDAVSAYEKALEQAESNAKALLEIKLQQAKSSAS